MIIRLIDILDLLMVWLVYFMSPDNNFLSPLHYYQQFYPAQAAHESIDRRTECDPIPKVVKMSWYKSSRAQWAKEFISFKYN